jgi:mRNA interferase HicA
MKRRDLIKRLEDAGYRKLRDDGDHTIYFKENHPLASVPRHRELNELTARKILKAAGLK